jgi:hypothetical protein
MPFKLFNVLPACSSGGATHTGEKWLTPVNRTNAPWHIDLLVLA